MNRKKILLIDDDDAVLDVMKIKIGSVYDVVAVSNPQLAVNMAKRSNPDLILCDIDMPDLSGGELSLKFMECDETRKIPFAYITSFVSAQEVDDMRGNVGGRAGIAKATPTEKMIGMIEKLFIKE